MDFSDFGSQIFGGIGDGLSNFGQKIMDNASAENAKSNGGTGLLKISNPFGDDDKSSASLPSASAPSAPSAPPLGQAQPSPPPQAAPAPAPAAAAGPNWLANMQAHPMWQQVPTNIQQLLARLYQQHQGGMRPPMPPTAQPGAMPQPFASQSAY